MYQNITLFREVKGVFVRLYEFDCGGHQADLNAAIVHRLSVMEDFARARRDGTWCGDDIVRIKTVQVAEIPWPTDTPFSGNQNEENEP